MRGERLTRRGALRLGGGTVLAGTIAGLAGCSGLLGGGDGGGDAEFTQWLPAPGGLASSGPDGKAVEHYHAGFIDVPAFEDSDDLKLTGIEGGLSGYVSRAASDAGLAFEDVETMITVGDLSLNIFTGSFDAGAVTDELHGNGYTEESEHGAFTIHSAEGEDSDRGSAAGVSDDAVILSRREPIDAALGWIEAVIDARNGDIDRYEGAIDDFDLLVDEVGTGVDSSAETHPETDEGTTGNIPRTYWNSRFEGQVAQGRTTRPDGDALRETWAKVFTEADAVPSEDLASWVEETEDGAPVGRFEEFSTEESGRVWTLSGSIDPEFGPPSETPTSTDPD